MKSKAKGKLNLQMTRGMLIILLSLSPVTPSIQAQAQDDFADSGFDSPPPPTIPNNSESSLNKSDNKNSSSKVLSQKQQKKFAGAHLEEITDENFPETIESFDFPNVEITDVIKAISELTGKNFILDPQVRGKITIIAPSKITVAEAYKAFLSALAINGFTVVPSGGFLKIKNSRKAQRDNIETYSGTYYPTSDQMITRIIHLKHVSAKQIYQDLRNLNSGDGDIAVYDATNSIILSDYGSNVDRVMKILAQLDVPGFEEQLEVIRIRYSKAKDLADLIDKIINKGQGSNRSNAGGFSSGVPRFTRSAGTSGQQGASYFMAFPDDRTNSIIAVGNKSGIQRMKKLIAQLDFPIRPEDSGGVFVYHVKYGKAEDIAQVLTGVVKDAAPKPQTGGSGFGNPFPSPQPFSPIGTNPTGPQTGGADLFGGDVKISADKSTNSLVITASKQDYAIVMNLLKKLDIPRDQVFVEAVIMEMNMVDTNSWGSGYYQYSDSGFGRGGFNTGVDVGQILNPLPTGESQPVILPFASSEAVEVSDPTKGSGSKIKVPNLVAFFQLLTTNKRTNILSTPKILGLDNQEAEIEVGDKVVTSVTTTTTSAGSTFSPNYEQATIKLTIKPYISPSSNTIRMEVTQIVKQPNNNLRPPKALQDSTLSLSERRIKTQIVINNGDTAVLGGLIKENESETVNKVPLLGDLPLIGWLFKGRNISKDKVNLLVFLTPKIIRSPLDSKDVLNNNISERLNFIKDAGGKDPYGRTIDKFQSKAQAPPAQNNLPVIEDPTQDQPEKVE